MDRTLTTKRAPALRRRLCRRIYRDDPCYRDGTTALLQLLQKPTGAFAMRTERRPLTVLDAAGAPLACCILMRAQAMPDTVMMTFFEALPEQQAAVALLADAAHAFAVERGANRVVMGLEGHVNNGLGFLEDAHSEPASFGSSYNPPWYTKLLEPYADRQHELRTFLCPVETFQVGSDRLRRRLAKRFLVRKGNFRQLREELALYTDLNNRIFASHPFYYPRDPSEDYELLLSFRPLLREENFLVVEFEGRPVGFLLWYPDFHELVSPGRGVGAGTLLRYRLLHQQPSRFKLAEFGVLGEHRGTGAILALVQACHELVRGRFTFCESGWIHEGNLASLGITTRWSSSSGKRYSVWEKDVAT